MSNIFHKGTGVDYFAFPQYVMTRLRDVQAEDRTKVTTIHLYLHLLYMSNKYTKAVHELKDSEIVAAMGINPRSAERGLQEAREQLARLKVVSSEGERGQYTYTILEPITGEPLAAYGEGFRVASYPPAAILAYYTDRFASLGLPAPSASKFHPQDGSPYAGTELLNICPRCKGHGRATGRESGNEWTAADGLAGVRLTTREDRPTLRLNLERGRHTDAADSDHERYTTFYCKACRFGGGPLWLERWIADKDGRNDGLDDATAKFKAHKRVKKFLRLWLDDWTRRNVVMDDDDPLDDSVDSPDEEPILL